MKESRERLRRIELSLHCIFRERERGWRRIQNTRKYNKSNAEIAGISIFGESLSVAHFTLCETMCQVTRWYFDVCNVVMNSLTVDYIIN